MSQQIIASSHQAMRNDGHRDSNAGLAPANAASGGTSSGGSSGSSNVVGVHYKVGKKIGEGSFGVIFEGERLMSMQGDGCGGLGCVEDSTSLFGNVCVRWKGGLLRVAFPFSPPGGMTGSRDGHSGEWIVVVSLCLSSVY